MALFVFPTSSLPVFHEYVAEGAVEDCVEEVCNAEVEDEDVGDCSHLVVAWTQYHSCCLIMVFFLALAILYDGHRRQGRNCDLIAGALWPKCD